MEQFLLSYGYIAFLPLAIIEGPIVTVVAAFFASQGHFNIYCIYALALLGDCIGDTIYYCIGRFGGLQVVAKYGARFHISEKTLEAVKITYFGSNKSLWKIITASKVTHAPSASVLITCGLLQTSFREFFFITTVNNIFKVLFFLLLGFYFGKYYKTIDFYLSKTWVIFIPIALLVLYLFYRSRYFKEQK